MPGNDPGLGATLGPGDKSGHGVQQWPYRSRLTRYLRSGLSAPVADVLSAETACRIVGCLGPGAVMLGEEGAEAMASEPVNLAWGRQEGEPEVAYTYFVTYRDLGRTRTVSKVADRVNKSRNYVHNLASRWRWVARTRAFDSEQDRMYAESLAERRREMADRHARIASALQGKLITRLQSLDPSKLSPADVARWLEVATRIERLALGLPDATTAHTGIDGGPIEVEVDDMSEERRTAFFRALLVEAQTRAGTAASSELRAVSDDAPPDGASGDIDGVGP